MSQYVRRNADSLEVFGYISTYLTCEVSGVISESTIRCFGTSKNNPRYSDSL